MPLRLSVGLLALVAVALPPRAGQPAQAQNVIATMPLGGEPWNVDLNPITNRVYVVNTADRSLMVLDETTGTTTTIPQDSPWSVAVDVSANRVYAVNTLADAVDVIDGTTNAVVDRIMVAGTPQAVAVNPFTSRIYVATRSSRLAIVDGATNSVLAVVPVGVNPLSLAVNPTTNRVFVTNLADSTVSVIDGATNAVLATLAVDNAPGGVVVHRARNLVYVASRDRGSLTTIDDAPSGPVVLPGRATLPSSSLPSHYRLALNPASDRLWVVSGGGHVAWLDLASQVVTTGVQLSSMASDVAVNPLTSRVYVPVPAQGTLAVLHDGGPAAVQPPSPSATPAPGPPQKPSATPAPAPPLTPLGRSTWTPSPAPAIPPPSERPTATPTPAGMILLTAVIPAPGGERATPTPTPAVGVLPPEITAPEPQRPTTTPTPARLLPLAQGLEIDPVIAWGSSAVGRLGDGTWTMQPAPVAVQSATAGGALGRAGYIAAGDAHSLATAALVP
jgi:YVTN family beta-propeller protein